MATTRPSDFSSSIKPASLPSWALPSPDQRRSLGVRMHDFPPPKMPFCHDWIPGVALRGTLAQTDRPYGGLLAFGAAVRLGLPSHTPSRQRPWVCYASLDLVQLSPTNGLTPTGPMKDSHLRSFIHTQRTSVRLHLTKRTWAIPWQVYPVDRHWFHSRGQVFTGLAV